MRNETGALTGSAAAGADAVNARKLGLPPLALFGFVAVFLVPVFWSF